MVHSSTLTVSAFKFLNLINKWVTLLAILVWPFGHLLKISNIYILDTVLFLVFVSFVMGENFTKYKNTPLFRSLNLFWFSLLTSILYNLWQQKLQAPNLNFLYYLRALVYPFVAFSVATNKTVDLKKTTQSSGLIFIIFAFLQYILLPDLRIYKNLGFDDHYYRLAGTLLDPNFTGAILATITIYLLLVKKLFASIIVLVGLALTFSRASYLSFLVTISTIIFQKKYLKLLFVFPVLAILIYFAPKPFGEGVNLFRTYSITSRLTSFNNGLQLYKESPFLGTGFGQLVGQAGQRVSVDNSYIFLLAGSGILGLASFLIVLYSVLKSTDKKTILLLLPILIHSFFNNSFFYIWIMSLFWFIVGYSLKGNKST